MYALFPVAGVYLNVLVVAGMGAVVGLLSGVFGVGGGFLLTPLLMMIGVPSTVAAASDSNQIVAASVSGGMAHSRMGNVDWKIGLLLVAGGWFGGLAGTQLVHRLSAAGNAQLVIQVSYVVMLTVVGGYMFYESVRSMSKKSGNVVSGKAPLLSRLPGQMYFARAGIRASVYALVGLGFMTGVLAALMGVGGGFIMLPVLIYLVGIPTPIAVGTSLVTVLFTSGEVTLTQSIVNHTVDVLLAMTLLAGSSVGAQIGVRVGRLLRAEQLRVVFSLIVLVTMGTMVYGLVAPHAGAHAAARSTLSGTGIGGYVYSVSRAHPAAYGVAAIAVAMLSGVLINFLFARIDSRFRTSLRRRIEQARSAAVEVVET